MYISLILFNLLLIIIDKMTLFCYYYVNNERNKPFMPKLENIDFFETTLIKSFINTAFHKYKPAFGWKRECEHCSIYFMSEGSLKFTLKGSEFMAEKDDVIFLKGNEDCYIENISDTQSTLYYIAFYPNENVSFSIGTITKNTGYANIFKDILDTHLSMAPFSNLKLAQLFIKLIYLLAVDSMQSGKDYAAMSKINSAAEYININYYKNITIDRLCKMTGYSASHLRRMFLKTFGVSPQNYIINKRIEMAKEMLLDIPERNIEEIADMLGICTGTYFCKLFKSRTGLSPMEYKKINAK